MECDTSDKHADIWALGVSVHRVFTCTNPDWQLAFPIMDHQANAMLPEDLQRAAVHKALLQQHDAWVC